MQPWLAEERGAGGGAVTGWSDVSADHVVLLAAGRAAQSAGTAAEAGTGEAARRLGTQPAGLLRGPHRANVSAGSGSPMPAA